MRTNGIFLAAALLVLAASANMADDGGVTSLASDIAHEVLNENSLGQLERANKDDLDLGESASVSDADVITDDLYYKPPPLSRSQVRRNNERWQKKGLQKFDGSHVAQPEDADITGVKSGDSSDATPLVKDTNLGEDDYDEPSSTDPKSPDYIPPEVSRAQSKKTNERWQKKGLQKFDGTHKPMHSDADITGVQRWDGKEDDAVPLATTAREHTQKAGH
jgi:hypothetical protein